jgi:hypothetical protein
MSPFIFKVCAILNEADLSKLALWRRFENLVMERELLS